MSKPVITQTSTCIQTLTWHNSWRSKGERFEAIRAKGKFLVRHVWNGVIVCETEAPTETAARELFERKVVAHYKED